MSAWAPDSSCEEIRLPDTRGQSSWEKAKSQRQRHASIFRAQTGHPCLYPLALLPSIIPALNCRVQEFKTRLSVDREALGWGAWLGDDRTGAQVPAPPGKQGESAGQVQENRPSQPGWRVSSCLTRCCFSNRCWWHWPLGALLGIRKIQVLPAPPHRDPTLPYGLRCVPARMCVHCPPAVSQVHPGAPPPTPQPLGSGRGQRAKSYPPTTCLGAGGQPGAAWSGAGHPALS